MLIESPRHRPGDIEAWRRVSASDLAWASLARFRERVEAAELEIVRFGREPCYASISWGKDSTVLADLVARVAPHVPLVWVRVEPIANPDCVAVRDRFLALYPDASYDEITVRCRVYADGAHATGTLERGFREAARRHGDRRMTGVRGAESAGRERGRRAHGSGTDKALSPLIEWSAADIWAYLAGHELPIHPAYAMSMGGALNRDRIRVSSLGGQRGTGMGRRDWERTYYADVLRAAGEMP